MLERFDYALPESAIAQAPVEPRDSARLLVDQGPGRPVAHRRIRDLPELLRPGDVLVLNTSRVLPARLRLRKPTGGAVEVLVLERRDDGTWHALVRPSRRVRPGTRFTLGADLTVEVGGAVGDGERSVRLLVDGGEDAELAALRRHGTVPLPPYITRPLDDPERYQTVFADRPGSVAAPTAGLHLTTELLDRCREAGARIETVELLVGLGTFRPITAPSLDQHHMHDEAYRVPEETMAACAEAERVVAVGTTTVRALETVASSGKLEGRTELFLRRPEDFTVVDALLTNFHLPRSTLLVLVEAFVGARWRALYDEALREGYRFLSFGDAMFLERRDAP